MIVRLALILVMAFSATVSAASAPERSLRPLARMVAVSTQLATNPRTFGAEPTVKKRGFFESLRPRNRSQNLRDVIARRKTEQTRGMVCGDPELQGVKLGAVAGRLAGCGVDEAVKLRSVSGVALSQQSVMDCGTAKALKNWVRDGLAPAVGSNGGGVSQIKVVSHYSCRTRNSSKGVKISEHGKGRALDIAGFALRDGRNISVLRDWGTKTWGKVLTRMHRSACGPFGTVLGPNANKAHRDHFHFDTARYRAGSYCR